MVVAAIVSRVSQAAEKRKGKLAELANKTGRIIYERAKLASEMLADREWLDAECGGDEGQGADYLTSHYFPDLGGLIQVETLVGMFRKLPEEKWEEYRWNLKRLGIEWREMNNPRPKSEADDDKPTGRGWVKRAEELEEVVSQTKFELKREKEAAARAETEAEGLRRRVRELEMVNARLEGRIAELERKADAG